MPFLEAGGSCAHVAYKSDRWSMLQTFAEIAGEAARGTRCVTSSDATLHMRAGRSESPYSFSAPSCDWPAQSGHLMREFKG